MALRVLLPGDPLPSSSQSSSSTILGPGLQSLLPPTTASNGKGKAKEDVMASKAGLMGFQDDAKSQKWWVEAAARRYIPQPPEPVIGIIIARHAEGYRVDIGSAQAASLDALAFEGATKRNKPNLKVGTIVYAHLLSTPAFSETEISCVDAATQKAAGFGELTGGFLIRGVELGRCRALLSPKNPILPKLGAKFPFEVAVGMNGRVWVNAADGEEERLIEVINEIRGRP
ncbi:hypothetical protein MNV49_006669 [Pseudohyphozyma bogoriensis]|nr:hypothetical protein MNV49_006669 [Pseudohyphozyma bogoriensis]